MSQSITPAWGINTVIIGSISVLTVKLRMVTAHLDQNYLNSLRHMGVATYTSSTGKYTFIKYTGLEGTYVSSEVRSLLHELRYRSALSKVHDKYNNTNPPGGGGGAVAADYGDNSFFDPMEAEL